jgi:hypothetical protein
MASIRGMAAAYMETRIVKRGVAIAWNAVGVWRGEDEHGEGRPVLYSIS